MTTKNIQRALLLLAAACIATACAKDTITQVDDTTGSSTTPETGTVTNPDDIYDASDFDRDITVVYSATTATVTGATADFDVVVSGNHVTITNNGTDKVRYRLSGSADDGWFKLYSTRRQALLLEGLTLTNPNGAAINVQSHKRTFVVLSGDNSLADGSSYTLTPEDEDEKAVLFGESQLVFSGNGTLDVTASGKSGIASDDYVNIVGGTIDVNMSSAAKVIDGDTLKPSCIKGKDEFILCGGTVTLTASGTGAKGISGDGNATFSGGTLSVTVSGSNFGSSSGGWPPGHGGRQQNDNSVGAKGIKFDGDIVISGGLITVVASKHEGIEAKGTLTVTGGETYSQSSDDAINSGSAMTISGGYVCAYSTGNDGLDANGNCYITGGVVYAIGKNSPEVAVDANTEGGYKLYIQGGTIIAIGGLENGAQLSQSCYQASSWSKSTWYSMTVGEHTYAFKTPASGGSKLVVSGAEQPTLKSSVTTSGGTTRFNGMFLESPEVSGGNSVSLTSYSSGGGWPH